MKKISFIIVGVITVFILFITSSVKASMIDVIIYGSDAIFLAGRTDVTIPPASDPWETGTHLIRHPGPTPEEIQETMPPIISVSAGDVIRVLDPAIGGISFYNGFGPPLIGPSGYGLSGSDLSSLDGISGYKGPQGALVGLFLDDSIPIGSAPLTLDFTPTGLGIEFTTLSPLLGQIFYMGDGVTDLGDFQTFIAPAGATRLALGIPDGFGFVGLPGAYDDNDGNYRVAIGIIPEPATMLLLGFGLIGVAALKRKVSK